MMKFGTVFLERFGSPGDARAFIADCRETLRGSDSASQ